MAGRRGYSGRSREDLLEAAESVTEMLAQLKGINDRGSSRGTVPSQEARWRPGIYSHQKWEDTPRNPEGSWRRDSSRDGPGFEGPPGNCYPPAPLIPDMERPQRPSPGARGQQQNRGGHRRQPPSGEGEPMTVQWLVEVLAQSPNFSISLLNLLEHHNVPSKQVRGTVSHHGHLFHLQEEIVTLAPRLKLCFAHSSPRGCQSRDVCDSLHMCPKFVLSWCSNGNECVLGHRWHTNHNLAILKRLSMEHVRYPVLRKLLRGGQRQGPGDGRREAGPLEVCQAYNEAGCDQLHCPSLHVCLTFVVGLTNCTRNNCQLNHNLLSPSCCHLLKQHNLPVNEAPRDVAMALLQANTAIKDRAGKAPSRKSRSNKNVAQGSTGKGSKAKDVADPLPQSGSRKARAPSKKDNKKNSSSATETESETDDFHGKEEKGCGTKESHTPKATKGKRVKQRVRKKGSKSVATKTDSEEDADDHSVKGKGQGNTAGKPSMKQKLKDNANQGPKEEVSNPPPKPVPRRTLWTHYLHGDVPDPQICYYSVGAMCRDEANGCQKLHSITHFHWQVKEKDGRWINLRPDQVTCIERAFCDPALNDVKLPRLDPSKLDSSVSGLFIMLGRDVWQADFSTSSLTNSTKSKTLQLRRLCTEPVVGQSIKASTYHWYFLDINKKWVKYGDVDTAGKQQLVSSVTSADIESHYLKTPQQPLTFKNSQFTFVLDLVSMTQTNQSTNMRREVRRRPEPHLPKGEEKEDKSKANSDLPTHWDAMQPEERSRLVTLGPASDEYKKVVGFLGTGTTVSAANVVKVDRIQNPFMWRALQNKTKDMMAVYKDATKVDMRYLFHGTSHNVVPSICNENFDWRLHGTATGQFYGRGTYFGTDAAISYGYCRPDPNGLKHMFVARVAVGSMIRGSSSMARPPINPATSMPYDSTVDNVTNPRLVVKYSTQEYYPEYLITLT